MASLRNLGLPGDLSSWQQSDQCSARIGSTCISRSSLVQRRQPRGGWPASPLSTGVQPHPVCFSSTTQVLQLITPNRFQGSVGICCFYPIPSGLSSLPYFFRGVLANTCFFIHLCFQWYFSALYEWSCAPSLPSRTSSSFRIPCISASLRRSRDSPVEEEMRLLDIWLFLRREHRRVLLWHSGRNPLLFPLTWGHRA